jgi:hypothetical protein
MSSQSYNRENYTLQISSFSTYKWRTPFYVTIQIAPEIRQFKV